MRGPGCGQRLRYRRLYRRLREWLARRPFIQRGRRLRYDTFVAACGLRDDDRIVDVGAGIGGALATFNRTNPIVAVDIDAGNKPWFEGRPNIEFVQGDATALPFDDASFDVAFSNSVIEHLPPPLQDLMAREVRRVASRYYVQTPNRQFPIEPHLWLPLVQFLPGHHWLERKIYGEPIYLVDERRLRELFPDAVIHRERKLGLTKSLMAIRA